MTSNTLTCIFVLMHSRATILNFRIVTALEVHEIDEMASRHIFFIMRYPFELLESNVFMQLKVIFLLMCLGLFFVENRKGYFPQGMLVSAVAVGKT